MFYRKFIPQALVTAMFAIAAVLGGAALGDDAAAKLIDLAARQLAQGKYLDALESYSRAAGIDDTDKQAQEGIRRAKLEIRQQMGDVSAARLADLMKQLERIDADRVGNLTARVAELEAERRQGLDRVAALETDLTIALQEKDRMALAATAGKTPPAPPRVVKDTQDVDRIKKELEQTRNECRTMSGKLADLNRQIKELEEDAGKAASAAEERVRKLVAKSELAEEEKRQAMQSARAAGKESDTLRLENRELAAKLDTLRNTPVPEPVVEVRTVDDAAEREALKAALNELETQNRNLSAALSEARSAAKAPVTAPPRDGKSEDRSGEVAKLPVVDDAIEREALKTALTELEAQNRNLSAALSEARSAAKAPVPAPPRDGKSEDRSGEVAELQTVVRSMEKELQALIGEKSELNVEVERLRLDLIASRATKPDRRLKGIERRTSEQALQIRSLEESVARTQESCEALLAGLNERAIGMGSARDKRESGQDAMAALTALKNRLSGLEVSVAKLSVQPPPATPPERLGASQPEGASRQDLRNQYKELAAASDGLRDDLAGAADMARSMRKELPAGVGLEDRLDAMDKMHQDAGRTIEKLKQQLRDIEDRIGDAG